MPATRWLVALGSAALLLAACGQADSGPLIGVRPQTVPSPVSVQPFDTTSIEATFAQQFVDLNNIQAINEGALAAGQLPIDTFLTLRQSLRLATLQTVGQQLLVARLTAISVVRSQVNQNLSGYQAGNVFAVLDNATAVVKQMQITIANEQLVDRARADFIRIGALRIIGFVLPQARLMVAGYLLGRLGAIYRSQVATLTQQISDVQSLGCNITDSQAYVNDLSAQSSALSYDGNIIVANVQSLSAAGYPGNKYVLKASHGPQQAGKNANFRAATDGTAARNTLAAHRALAARGVVPC